jgi:tetratricopeptide (TPR) repeat protein
VVLAIMIALTLWAGAGSPALEEAEAAYRGDTAGADVQGPWLRRLRERFSEVTGGSAKPAKKKSPPVPLRPDFRLALRRALDHLETRPGDPDASLLAALCLSQLDYAEQAESYYEPAASRRPLTREQLHIRAIGLARGNLRDRAAAAYEEILRTHQDDDEALQKLAAVYYSQSRYKEALNLAVRLSRSPTKKWSVAGHALVGVVHHDEHRPGPAVAAYEKVLALDPELQCLSLPPDLFFSDLARDLIDEGRASDARSYLHRYLGSRDDPALLDVLGSAYLAEGNESEAEQCWKRAADLNPRLHRPWLNLGKLSLRRGRIAEAITFLDRSHAIDPRAYGPVYQMGLAYRRLGRLSEAKKYGDLAESLRRVKLRTGSNSGTMTDEKP